MTIERERMEETAHPSALLLIASANLQNRGDHKGRPNSGNVGDAPVRAPPT
jgi:hypothetical protein